MMLGIIAGLILIAASNFLSNAKNHADLNMGMMWMIFSVILFVIAGFLAIRGN